MFRIRAQQWNAFREVALEDYEAGVLDHIRRYLPRHYARLGDGEARRYVSQGILKAASHGLTGERDVRDFVDIIIVHGESFDRDCLWAREVFDRPSQTPTTLLARLRAAAIDG